MYLYRPEFAEYEYRLFRTNQLQLRKNLKDKDDRAAAESAALAHDRRIHPKPTHNHRGEPRWEGSEAEQLLQFDVDEGKHESMKPQELYHSRKEYQNYTLDVFRGHIYQEEKRRKFLAYCATKKKNS